MNYEIKRADNLTCTCTECTHSMPVGEPYVEMSVKNPWEDPGPITIMCFACFVEMVDDLKEIRQDFAAKCNAFARVRGS